MPFYTVIITEPFGGGDYEVVVEADSVAEARKKANAQADPGAEIGLPKEIEGATTDPEQVAETTYERPDEFKDVQFTQTDVLPSFTDFINPDLLDPTITNFVEDGFVTPYESTLDPPTVKGDDFFDLTNGGEGDAGDAGDEGLQDRIEKIEGQLGNIEKQFPIGSQTFDERARALEAMDPYGFASFVEGLKGTRYGDALSGAGPYSAYLRRQVDPLRQAYIGSELFPMIGVDSEEGRNLGLTEGQLAHRNTDDFKSAYSAYLKNPGILNSTQVDEDTGMTVGDTYRLQLETGGFKPGTFAAFTRDALDQSKRGIGGIQQNLLDQFRKAAGAAYGSATPIAQSFIRPETQEQADVVSRLAQQAMGARYSPIIQGALGRGMNLGNIWSDYTSQSIPQIGAMPTPQAPNFFDFIGNRMVLL